MSTVLELLSSLLLALGSFFCLVGAWGLWRFPDIFSRMHATGVTDTLGAALILLALLLRTPYSGLPALTIVSKLVLILLFMLMTSPTATHALAKSALHGGVKPLTDKQKE